MLETINALKQAYEPRTVHLEVNEGVGKELEGRREWRKGMGDNCGGWEMPPNV